MFFGSAIAAPLREQHTAGAVQATVNNFGDSCRSDGLRCNTDDDCACDQNVGGACECYYTADSSMVGRFVKCEDAYKVEMQVGPVGHCQCSTV